MDILRENTGGSELIDGTEAWQQQIVWGVDCPADSAGQMRIRFTIQIQRASTKALKKSPQDSDQRHQQKATIKPE